ncbi:MAG: hypothetical protein OHK93_005069 [Ramalina farinacea]|uniref:Nucleolar protein 12 n=1 Tax=Ramalina farinacea TaxID=258253 RepID=A0AA43QVC0_9LECA|nr:hypothetical protein [Ramalina farinacea]
MSLGKRKHAFPPATPAKKRRKSAPAIEEITFDTTARQEYLTGFHKRKQQRIKNAKEEAAKREREEKIVARKALRDERKADLERHVEAVNATLPDQEDVESESEGLAGGEEWGGVEEAEEVDREEEYVDEDKYATVTVEAVDVSKDGVKRARDEDEGGEQDEGADTPSGRGEGQAEKVGAGRLSHKRSDLKAKNKPKKKKFRYESKAERKMTRHKERSGSKARAKLRRS